MPVSITQILPEEPERLHRAFGAMTSREGGDVSDSDLETIFRDLAALRSSANDAVRRRANELSKDDLIGLQSNLHAALDELLSKKIEELIERRALAMAERAERDPVTKLPNRAAFNRRLADEIERARRYGRRFSLVLLDVDCFKSVNDQFGHPRGDQVLSEVARIVESSLRKSDAVFRYGGDEFAAICPETPGEAMVNVLRRLESNLRAWRVETRLSRQLGISWGVAAFPTDAEEENELIGRADERLYACKRVHRRSLAARP